jgi:hypothetical protein
MYHRILRASFLAGVATFGSLSFAAAQAPALSVRLVTTFTYPVAPNQLSSVGAINSNGDIVGTIVNPTTEIAQGVIRYGSGKNAGKFSPPFGDPNTTGSTFASAINDASVIAGTFYLSGVGHGYVDTNGAFTTYDAPGGVETNVAALNNASDLGGTYSDNQENDFGFVTIGSHFSQVAVAGGIIVSVNGINDLTEAVGSYETVYHHAFTNHGFFRNASGTITPRLNFPGSDGTLAEGINNNDLIVGEWFQKKKGRNNTEHAFILQLPGTFVSFDVPKSMGSDTAFSGINSAGTISGSYFGTDGKIHGLIAQVGSQ